MPKAKTLDRLELTRKKFARIKPAANPHKQGYSKCPECGRYSLVHEGGCEHCTSCSYSKCG